MSAVVNIITDNLPIWSSAIQSKSSAGRGTSGKRNLYGVKKLRELILDLAVRGLLVPQDPSDEPASVLLEKIAVEKERLVNEGKLKKQKRLPHTKIDKNAPDVPQNWEYEKFGNLFAMEYGSGLKKSARTNTGEFPVYGSNGIVGTHEDATVFEPCIVIGRKGSAGALNLCLHKGCWVTDVAYSIVPPTLMNLNFTFIQLQSLRLDVLGKGIKPGLNRNEAYSLDVFVPPLAEQHRIVAKVDELMALCDTLEQQQEDSIQAHETLVEVLLEALSSAVDADTFQAAWGRISEHFDALFTTDHSINKLKETILQLAVMGKLVPQDPSDEPASVLLENIAAERERLVKEGKIKKQKPEAKIHHKSSQFTVADGWAKTTFGKVMLNLDSQRIPISMQDRKLRSGPYPYYGASGVIDKIDGYLFDKTLLLIGEDGANLVNRSTPIAFLATEKFWVNNHAHVLDAIDDITLHYMSIHINAIDLLPYITGMAQPKMNQAKMNSIHIMLPPLAEQHRIVAKVDELMGLCDQLKNSLQQAQETQIQLTDAVVENAL